MHGEPFSLEVKVALMAGDGRDPDQGTALAARTRGELKVAETERLGWSSLPVVGGMRDPSSVSSMVKVVITGLGGSISRSTPRGKPRNAPLNTQTWDEIKKEPSLPPRSRSGR